MATYYLGRYFLLYLNKLLNSQLINLIRGYRINLWATRRASFPTLHLLEGLEQPYGRATSSSFDFSCDPFVSSNQPGRRCSFCTRWRNEIAPDAYRFSGFRSSPRRCLRVQCVAFGLTGARSLTNRKLHYLMNRKSRLKHFRPSLLTA